MPNTFDDIIPENPDYFQAINIVEKKTLPYWRPVIDYLLQKHNLSQMKISQISEGSNALFNVGNEYILKIVPPNWKYQGEAEVASIQLLSGKLPLSIPNLLVYGEINNWFYVIMTLLPGENLAVKWPTMSLEDRSIITQEVGYFMRTLHQVNVAMESPLRASWSEYINQLYADCLARHQRKNIAPQLLDQLPTYLEKNPYQMDDGQDIFIHMDLHPWNIMIAHKNDKPTVSGILDFGDAIIGRSRLLELATPLLFLCQGNKQLCETLLRSYSLLSDSNRPQLQTDLMVTSLLRPACDFNFVMAQVARSAPRDTWEQIGQQLFPI
ncbi:phosphotransferase family protein [Aliikangiella maris]|uniref:Aminoglycoside 3'-phosphotransferase/choline kinase family protein n=2 Tax=Aliikangiella maris TaxID=3162458 RepID=A0ABV3MJM4_9GAMM